MWYWTVTLADSDDRQRGDNMDFDLTLSRVFWWIGTLVSGGRVWRSLRVPS